jgi:hypothetical protein
MPAHSTLSRRRFVLGMTSLAAAPVHTATARTAPDPGDEGVALLQSWVEGKVPKRAVPLDWQAQAPARGAAFYCPRDWSVTEIADPNIYDLTDGNPFGTWAVAEDASAGVLLLNLITNAPLSARDAAWGQIEQAIGAARFDRLADETYTGAFALDVAFAAGRTRTLVCAALTMTTPDTVMGGSYVYVQLALAEAAAFDAAADAIFLPMLQNLVTDGGSACDDDPDDDDYALDDCPSATSGT